MEINKGKALRTINNEISHETINALLDHFAYSIADIQSWDELTDAEKKIVPKDLFLKLTDEKAQNEFKEGDFVYRKLSNGSEWVSIHKGIDKTDTSGDIISSADITIAGSNHPYKSFDVWPLCFQTDVEIERLATEDEKQRLLDFIDENGYVWDAEKLEIKRKNR